MRCKPIMELERIDTHWNRALRFQIYYVFMTSYTSQNGGTLCFHFCLDDMPRPSNFWYYEHTALSALQKCNVEAQFKASLMTYYFRGPRYLLWSWEKADANKYGLLHLVRSELLSRAALGPRYNKALPKIRITYPQYYYSASKQQQLAYHFDDMPHKPYLIG